MKEYSEGAQWRRWDLHIHTPGTNKNDNFEGSTIEEKWQKYCEFLNTYSDAISVIGITDYWSIENYFELKKKVDSGEITKNFDLILPNVELRITPVTGKGKPVNIHCIFNPEIDSELDSRFFQKIRMSSDREYSATRNDLTEYGRHIAGSPSLDEEAAYKTGIENFVINWSNLEDLFKKDPELRKNTVVIVSNGSGDGASGVTQHKDFFTEDSLSQLEGHRRQIYKISDAIFSSRPGDIEFFYGENYPDYSLKCGKPKPCFHGCDAHSLEQVFEPKEQRYCWVKANPTFEGLLQTLNEPRDRVYIGEEPEALKIFEENKTKYVKALIVDSVDDYKNVHGVWFDGFRLSFNKQLVAIIGNKGSGKSALADIIALCGDSLTPLEFLTPQKFKKNGLASKFKASMYWEDGTDITKGLGEVVESSAHERIKYISQNHFEALCTDFDQIEGFRVELENVVFSHLPDEKMLGCNTFNELIELLKGNSEIEIAAIKAKLNLVNEKIIALEIQRNTKFVNKLSNQLEQKQKEIDAHDSIRPEEVEDPTKGKESDEQKEINNQISNVESKITDIEAKIKNAEDRKIIVSIGIEKLKQIKSRVEGLENTFNAEKESIGIDLDDFDLSVDEVISIHISYEKLDEIIKKYADEYAELIVYLEGDDSQEHAGYHHTLEILRKTKSELISQLGAPEKLFQKYLAELSKWEHKRKIIVGDVSDITTLSGIKARLKYINEEITQDIEKLRAERTEFVKDIYATKAKLVDVYKNIKQSIDASLSENHDLLGKYDVAIKSSFEFNDGFIQRFQSFINQSVKGSFYGKEPGQLKLKSLTSNVDLSDIESLLKFLDIVQSHLEADHREGHNKEMRYIDDQMNDPTGFYNYLYSLEYLDEAYSLEMGGKQLQQLSPGEKGALLLIFYLLLDKDNKPLVIDQPEDNLDNQSVSRILVPFIKKAKLRRQIFMVTHNPNLAVVADAEQVIHVNIEKDKDNRVTAKPGAIESPTVNRSIVDILEGTMPAFRQRDNKYLG